jgi:RHS repeat-associated protein
VTKDCAVTSTAVGATCATTDRSTAYGYDNAGQLTSAVAANDGATGVTVGRAYTYGNRGNRRSHTDLSSAGVSTTTSTSNLDNELVTAGTTRFGYDQAGRRVSASPQGGTATTARYDAMGRLAGTTTGAVDDARSYDPLGNYASGTNTNGGTTTSSAFYWDIARPIPEISDHTINGTAYASVLGERRVQLRGANLAYDYQGSVIGSGGTEPTSYGAFGEPAGGTVADRSFGYRGELTLGGQPHLRSRDYDPGTGTFTTRDSEDGVNGTAVVANPYHYADNDPVNKVDPTGRRPHDQLTGEPCDQLAFRGVCVDPMLLAQVFGGFSARVRTETGMIGLCATAGVTMQSGDLPSESKAFLSKVLPSGAGVSGCLLDDGDKLWLAETTVSNAQAIGFSVGVSAGFLVTNATSIRDFAGPLTCWGGSANHYGGEVCLSATDNGGYSGIWSLYLSVGYGKGTAVSAQQSQGVTRVRAIWDHPYLDEDVIWSELLLAAAGVALNKGAGAGAAWIMDPCVHTAITPMC